jgi:hypothetical protein
VGALHPCGAEVLRLFSFHAGSFVIPAELCRSRILSVH